MDDATALTPEDAEEVVRCGSCSALVRRKATQQVVRVYSGRPFSETWCIRCVKNVDDNTSFALGAAEGEDPSTIGMT